MANERLYQFPPKTTPVPADILFLGDSSNGWNECSTTIAQVVTAYPNLAGAAGVTLTNNQFPYINNSGAWAAATAAAYGLSLLSSASVSAALSVLTLPIGLTTPTGMGNGVLDTSPTINTATLTNPTVSSGTFTSPTLNTPTITTPTINSGGTFNGSPTIETPTIDQPVINQGNLAQPTIEQPLIIGVVTNSLAAAGDVGEIISNVRPSASNIGMANNAVQAICTITLTPGDWDIWGNVTFITDATSNCSYQAAWISTDNTVTADNSITNQLSSTTNALITNGLSAPQLTMQLSAATTTVYLMAIANFSASTLGCCGGIYARRRR